MVEPLPNPDGLDPMRFREELEAALEQPELAALEDSGETTSPEVEEAARRLATALGYCRLFGVSLPEDLDGDLPPRTAEAAARGLIREVERLIEDVRRLEADWYAVADQAEADDLVCGLLEARMDAHAASEAIDDADDAAVEARDPDRARLRSAVMAMLDALDQFDDALDSERGILSTVVDTPLLSNWRAMLAPNYRELLPWWLDGTLELIAEQTWQEALAWGPDERAWAALRRRREAESPATLGWRPRVVPAPLMAAAEEPATDGPWFMPLFWRSPDDRFEARLIFPQKKQFAAEEPLMIDFSRVEDREDAVELAGRTARLGGLSLTLDDRGRAHLTAGQLPDSDEPPPLRLDPDDTPWTLRDL